MTGLALDGETLQPAIEAVLPVIRLVFESDPAHFEMTDETMAARSVGPGTRFLQAIADTPRAPALHCNRI